jgi:hypothetical protein
VCVCVRVRVRVCARARACVCVCGLCPQIPTLTWPRFKSHARFTIGVPGISDGAAAAYSGALFRCISADSAAKSDGAGLAHLVAEQTPGGLNEGAVKMHKEAGCYEAQKAALDAALDRLTKAAAPS